MQVYQNIRYWQLSQSVLKYRPRAEEGAMETQVRSLVEMIEALPPELQQEVREFVTALVETRVRPRQKYLQLTWAGGLREFRDRFTSLELQQKALEWWGD
jgi:uncharacterized membrane protein YccC